MSSVLLKFSRLDSGLRTFLTIWGGQTISLIGTSMTRFALLTWAFDQTKEATTLALLGFSSFIFYVLLSPLAGVLVDRWNRRVVMFVTDLGAALITLMVFLLALSGNLQIWHLYLAEALTGAFEAFQVPAYQAAITMLIPKQHYARASGLNSFGMGASRIIAPFLAGLVLTVSSLSVVMIFDLLSCAAALITLLFVHIPRSPITEPSAAKEPFRQQMTFGFRWIWPRKGLLYLLLLMACANFMASLTYFGVMPAMILARSGGNAFALAAVRGALGVGGLVGSALLATWGGPKRQIHGVLLFCAVSFLLGDFLMGVGQSLPFWIFAALTTEFFIPFLVGADRSIWQRKVPPDVQGRVFAMRDMCRLAAMPIGYLITGPLADQVFVPAMMPGGALSYTFGWLVGTGPGAGMGLMFVCTALLGGTISLCGYLSRAVRQVESDLPDHTALEPIKTDEEKSQPAPTEVLLAEA
jgi:MFS transporter, DHA3 family, macrolide efflux protein